MRLGSADPGYTLRRTAAKRQFGRLENVFVFFFFWQIIKNWLALNLAQLDLGSYFVYNFECFFVVVVVGPRPTMHEFMVQLNFIIQINPVELVV